VLQCQNGIILELIHRKWTLVKAPEPS